MFLKCEIELNYRQQQHQGLRRPSKRCSGAIRLYRKCGDEHRSQDSNYSLMVFTNKSKNGVKYRVLQNVDKIFSRFVDKGKATICFKEPQHDICISKADPHDLKRLIHGIKLSIKGENVPDIQSKTNKHCHNILESTKTSMKISSRSSYPISKPFPSSLVKLFINGCLLVKFDERILKISTLCTLDLANNYLQELPESMDYLTNLKELNLSRNKFKNVPLCLFKPVFKSNLRLLDLSSNLIESLPCDMCLFDNITNIRLDDNRINSLPYNIAMLKSVRYLNIAQNNIGILPHGFSSLNIHSLDLSRNPLKCGKSAQNIIEMRLQPIHTLFETACRTVIDKHISYCKISLPGLILKYLSLAKECLCGKVCFQSYALYVSMIDLGQIAHTVTADALESGRMSAPIEGYLCSFRCYYKWLNNPNAMWK